MAVDDQQAPLDHTSRRQAPISLSSAESEFYAGTGAACNGLGAKSVMEFYGYKVVCKLHMDSSSGRAVAKREGRGKIKHLDVRSMWLQQLVKQKVILPVAVDTLKNLADLGTKTLPVARLVTLREKCGIYPRKEVDESFAHGKPDIMVEESPVDPTSSLHAGNTITSTVGAVILRAIVEHCRRSGRLEP